jgi:hypothetical protein
MSVKAKAQPHAKSCVNCNMLTSECCDGELGSHLGWYECETFPTKSNLRSFPFRTEQPCFTPRYPDGPTSDMLREWNQIEGESVEAPK